MTVFLIGKRRGVFHSHDGASVEVASSREALGRDADTMRRAYEAAMRAQAAVESLVGSAVPHSSRKDPFAGLVPWELTTAAPLRVPARRLDLWCELFEFAGVCHLSDAVPPNLLADCLTAANAHTTAVRKAVTDCGFDPDGRWDFDSRKPASVVPAASTFAYCPHRRLRLTMHE